MKKDKDIQRIADESLKQYSDENFRQILLLRQESKKESGKESKRRLSLSNKKLAISSCVAAAVVLIVAVTTLCFYLVPGGGEEEIPQYAYGEEKTFKTSIEEINSALFGVDIDPENVISTYLVKDGKSGDSLYYMVNFQEGMTSCRVDIIVNKYYRPLSKATNGKMRIGDIDFNVYEKTEYYEQDGLYVHSLYAKTYFGGREVIIQEYTACTGSADNGFEEFFKEMFIFG